MDFFSKIACDVSAPEGPICHSRLVDVPARCVDDPCVTHHPSKSLDFFRVDVPTFFPNAEARFSAERMTIT